MANFKWENDFEVFENDCSSWFNLGITIKPHKVKGFCKCCKKWTWVVQRQSYTGFTCQCVCGIIYAVKSKTKNVGDLGAQRVGFFEKHFGSIEELGKHFNLEYYE